MLRAATAVGVMWVCLVGGAWAEGVEQEQEAYSPGGHEEGAFSPRGLEEGVFSPGRALREGLMELGGRATMFEQSTVYAFNFNNLLILLAIKLVVLLMVGGLGLGFGVGRRSLDGGDTPWLDRSDMLFTLTYLVSDGVERYDCLNRLACLDHHKAQDLLTAASIMLKGAKFLKPFFGYSLEKYEKVTWGLEDAILYKREGGSCRSRYSCSAMPSL